jgi:PKHD-type hydroxylase
MLVHIPNLLTAEQVTHLRGQLAGADWVDGKATTGSQSDGLKNNLQLPEDAPAVRALGEIILSALGQSERFMSATLALRVLPPMFNRYDPGMDFGTGHFRPLRPWTTGGRPYQYPPACRGRDY